MICSRVKLLDMTFISRFLDTLGVGCDDLDWRSSCLCACGVILWRSSCPCCVILWRSSCLCGVILWRSSCLCGVILVLFDRDTLWSLTLLLLRSMMLTCLLTSLPCLLSFTSLSCLLKSTSLLLTSLPRLLRSTSLALLFTLLRLARGILRKGSDLK